MNNNNNIGDMFSSIEKIKKRFHLVRKTVIPVIAFQPHEGQMAVIKSTAREVRVLGDNRSGKTAVGAYIVACHLLGIYPPWFPKENRIMEKERFRPFYMRVYTEDYKRTLQTDVLPAIMSMIPEGLTVRKEKVNNAMTIGLKYRGAIISFLTYNQRGNVAEGGAGHFVWFNEPPRNAHTYTANLRWLIDYKGQMLLTMTELAKNAQKTTGIYWLDERYSPEFVEKLAPEDRPETFVFTADMNSKHVAKKNVTYFRNRLTEDEKKERFGHSEASTLGTVFEEAFTHKNIAPLINIDERDDIIVMGIDPHGRGKPPCILHAIKKPNGKIYIFHEFYDKVLTIRQVIGMLIELERSFVIKPIIRMIDKKFSDVAIDDGGKGFIKIIDRFNQEAKFQGLPGPFVSANPTVDIGLDTTAYLFQSEQLFICSNCKRTIRAIQTYHLEDKGASKESPKHFIDALRYIIMSPKLGFGRGYQFIQKQQEKTNIYVDGMPTIPYIRKLINPQRFGRRMYNGRVSTIRNYT